MQELNCCHIPYLKVYSMHTSENCWYMLFECVLAEDKLLRIILNCRKLNIEKKKRKINKIENSLSVILPCVYIGDLHGSGTAFVSDPAETV